MEFQYKCKDCGHEFDEPARWVERHGFDDGLYERWSACPECGSCDYVEAYELDDADEEVDEC